MMAVTRLTLYQGYPSRGTLPVRKNQNQQLAIIARDLFLIENICVFSFDDRCQQYACGAGLARTWSATAIHDEEA